MSTGPAWGQSSGADNWYTAPLDYAVRCPVHQDALASLGDDRWHCDVADVTYTKVREDGATRLEMT